MSKIYKLTCHQRRSMNDTYIHRRYSTSLAIKDTTHTAIRLGGKAQGHQMLLKCRVTVTHTLLVWKQNGVVTLENCGTFLKS